MTTDNSIDAAKALAAITSSTNTKSTSTSKTSSTDSASESSGTTSTISSMGADEFLTLLVNQLQNQDPLDPMSNEEFAVQLAQFSQVEQLISVNDKLDGLSTGDANSVSSMASYLGREVVLADSAMQVSDGSGSNLLVDVPSGTQSLRVDFMDDEGTVVGQQSIEEVDSGSQVLRLENLDVSDGNYDVRVVSVDSSGQFVDLDAKVTGTVEGFVLEPEPMLLVDGQEVSLEDVEEVHMGESS